MKDVCKIDECDKFVHGKGFCSKHYARYVRKKE